MLLCLTALQRTEGQTHKCVATSHLIEGEEHALRLLVQLVKLSSRKFGRIAGTVTTEGKW